MHLLSGPPVPAPAFHFPSRSARIVRALHPGRSTRHARRARPTPLRALRALRRAPRSAFVLLNIPRHRRDHWRRRRILFLAPIRA